jgi:hypothetical protein
MRKILALILLPALIFMSLPAVPVVRARAALPASRPPSAQTRSLESVLNPDGTLNLQSGASGSFSAAGFQLGASPDGRPRFVKAAVAPPAPQAPTAPQVAGDQYWDRRFLTGLGDPSGSPYVFAIAINGSDVYVGGSFNQAGGVPVNNIARWDNLNHHWYALGPGVNNRVQALVIHGSCLYVGGYFNFAGSVQADELACWNLTSHTWSPISSAITMEVISPSVYALAVDASGNLIVGGQFNSVGGVAARNVARFNGVTWSALGAGLGTSASSVYALAASGADVYAGGDFTGPCFPCSYVAHWTGSAWVGVGLGMSGGSSPNVRSIVINGSNIFVGGDFTTVTDTVSQKAVNGIAMFNGSVWTALPTGLPDSLKIWGMTLGPDGLYVGGQFTATSTTTVNYVMRWDGANWNALVKPPPDVGFSGVDNNVFALATAGTDVYVGGAFLNAFGAPGNGIMRWSTAAHDFYALGGSTNGNVYAVAIDGPDVYVGGTFNSAGGVAANNIAKWNSQTDTWSPLAEGVTGCDGNSNACYGAVVWTIVVNGNIVYVGGDFVNSGIYATHSIAQWDKTLQRWFSVSTGGVSGCLDIGLGCDANVFAMVATGAGVTIAGNFTNVSLPSFPVGHVAYFDGLNWNALTDGFTNGTNGNIYALLYDGFGWWLGGGFTSPRSGLVYFDGSSWNAPGSGLTSGAVYAIQEAIGPNNTYYLYIGGTFINLGPNNVSNIARLPEVVGGDWQPLGSGLNSEVNALAWNGPDLIAGGYFTASGLLGLNHIGRYNTFTDTWSAVGSGVDENVFALAASNSAIYTGGRFRNAGPGSADFFARWADFQTLIPVVRK